MRAVYLDESARDNQYYFFGGLIVDDAAARSIEAGLDGISRLVATEVPGFDPQTEFHGNEMFHGEGKWDPVPVIWRAKASELVAKAVQRSGAEFIFRGINLVNHRARYGVNAYPPHLLTLAQILEEVDQRIGRTPGEVAVVLADDHHSAASSRRNLRDFKIGAVPGYTQGQLRNLSDTMYFGPSHASRLLQATDVATYFMNRKRTIAEHDSRAQGAVDRIVASIRHVLVSEYVWLD